MPAQDSRNVAITFDNNIYSVWRSSIGAGSWIGQAFPKRMVVTSYDFKGDATKS